MMLAWYKLNGNLLDSSGNGRRGILFGSPTVSINEGIVLPKCYEFNSTGKYCIFSSDFLPYGSDWSVSFFVKFNSAQSSYNNPIRHLPGGYQFFADSSQNCYLKSTKDNTQVCFLWGLVVNKWYHVCFRSSNNKIDIFLDGVKTISNYSTPNANTSTEKDFYVGSYTENNNSRFQDFRIYDHCLSYKEIYDLSKAKILHYTFDDVEEPTANLLPNPITLSGYVGGGSAITTQIKVGAGLNGSNSYRSTRGAGVNTGDWQMIPPSFQGVLAGDTLTMSLLYKTSYPGFQFALGDWDTVNGVRHGWNIIEDKAFNSEWRIRVARRTFPQASNFTYIGVNSIGLNGWVEICLPQVEKKDHATSFVNGIRDQIIVRDKSDYGNDSLPLTIANTPAFVEDCKIGKQSLQQPNKKYVETSNVFNFNNTKTISFWFKSPPLTNPNKGVYLLSNPNGTAYIFLGSPSGIPAESNISFSVLFGKTATTYDFDMRIVRGKEIFTDNKWHHACIIFDGIDNRIYIDSVQEVVSYVPGSATTTGSSFFEKIQIGEPTNSAGGYESNNQVVLDDLRIYATALTAEDVKEIYQSRANLDDKGNLKVTNIVENESTSFSLSEKGVLTINNISELGVTEGLIAHYPLNGDARDHSGNGNDGTVVGATVAAGLGQKCYYFAKSVNERIIIPTNPIFDTKHLSIQLWVKPNDISSTLENNFLCKESQYEVKFVSGELFFSVETIDPAVWFWVNTGIRVNENEWVNFYFKYNAISFDVYKNGVLAASIPHNKGELVSGTGPLQLGNRESVPGSSDGFKGSLQDVRIYRRALTPEEVSINYNLTKADKTAMIQVENGTTYVSQIKED